MTRHAPGETRSDLGPQCPSDSAFTARMRLHQSWYRSEVLGLPAGTGPTPGSRRSYGNMLQRADGAAGRNFLTPGIFQVAQERVSRGTGAVEPYRLFHNLLSSQPMCFNLFGPLVADRGLARRLVDRLVPEDVAEVNLVDLEWAPEPVGDYLDDGTAFDAYVEYTTHTGLRCALGVETKLTEPFSPKVYDGESYRRWMRGPNPAWRAEAWDRVQARGHNQLWRDHLLAVALRDHPQRRVDGSRLLVLHHGLDPGCGRVLAGYRALLREGDASLMSRTLDALVGLWEPALDTDAERRWLQDFRLRYLDLHRSAGRTDPQ